MDEDTYTKRVKCNNCGHKQSLNIPKGVTILDALVHAICPHCECTEFQEDTSKPIM